MIPSLEHDARGWWVRCLDGNGRAVRVGPFDRKGEATWFLVRLQWGQ